VKFLSLGHFVDAMTKKIIPTVDDLIETQKAYKFPPFFLFNMNLP
jgi:hypothetical protein